jgi:hypothetical protein
MVFGKMSFVDLNHNQCKKERKHCSPMVAYCILELW